MPNPTLLDIAKLNGNGPLAELIEASQDSCPETRLFPSAVVKGLHYTTVVRTALPSVEFRAANEGITPSKSTFAAGMAELFLLDGIIEVDMAVAQAYEGGVEKYKQIESEGTMASSLVKIASQIWYGQGTGGDAKGFPGIKAITPKTAVDGASTNVIDAGGTTASTASSLYAVRLGPRGVQILFGQGATLTLDKKWTAEQKALPNNKAMPIIWSSLCAWVGLSVGTVGCVGRILNLTADSGKGLTDSLVAQLLEKFPRGNRPHLLFASRRSVRQLQQSRTPILMGSDGKEIVSTGTLAPWPTESCGIPLVDTDAILNTDAIE